MIARSILILWLFICCGLVWVQAPALISDPRCSSVGLSLLLGGVAGFGLWVTAVSGRVIRKANAQ